MYFVKNAIIDIILGAVLSLAVGLLTLFLGPLVSSFFKFTEPVYEFYTILIVGAILALALTIVATIFLIKKMQDNTLRIVKHSGITWKRRIKQKRPMSKRIFQLTTLRFVIAAVFCLIVFLIVFLYLSPNLPNDLDKLPPYAIIPLLPIVFMLWFVSRMIYFLTLPKEVTCPQCNNVFGWQFLYSDDKTYVSETHTSSYDSNKGWKFTTETSRTNYETFKCAFCGRIENFHTYRRFVDNDAGHSGTYSTNSWEE